jgi:hypothetical protein
MDLAGQLRELRALAGNPSYRSLERLIDRQGRRQRMARSTIQEKIAGASAMKLPQVLAIVEALAEYARINDTPLPKREIDPEVWRDRVVAASKKAAVGVRDKIASPNRISPTRAIKWNLDPLHQAQMDDLVELIRESHANPVADWLPKVLRAMMQAEMALTDFLEKAAEDSPQGVISTVKALEEEFPYWLGDDDNPWGGRRNEENEATVSVLIREAAKRHGGTASPAIVVGLRRSQVGYHVPDFLTRVATWFLAPEIEKASSHLRVAALGKDADALFNSVGTSRQVDRVFEVVSHLYQKSKADDAELVLRAIAVNGIYRLRGVMTDFEKRNAPEAWLMEIARGVKYEKYEEFIQKLKEWDDDSFAALLRRAADEPPF